MRIEVTRQALAAMRAAQAEAAPDEACGLLFGTARTVTRFVPARNVHPDPRRFFEIDPQALIDAHRASRAGGPMLVGYFHSHPAGAARPSRTDQAQAARDGMIWAIAGHREITLWRDAPGGFAPLSYRSVDP